MRPIERTLFAASLRRLAVAAQSEGAGLQGCQMAKFDPFLSLDCASTPSTLMPPPPPPWRNPRKGRDQILPSGNLAWRLLLREAGGGRAVEVVATAESCCFILLPLSNVDQFRATPPIKVDPL